MEKTHRKYVVPKTDAPNAAAHRFGRLQSWWDSAIAAKKLAAVLRGSGRGIAAVVLS